MFFYEYRCMLLSYYEQNKFLILANKKSKPLGIISYKMKSFLPISEKKTKIKKHLHGSARNYYNISCGQKRQ